MTDASVRATTESHNSDEWPYCRRCGFRAEFCFCETDEVRRLRVALEAIVAEDSTLGYIMQQIAKEALHG